MIKIIQIFSVVYDGKLSSRKGLKSDVFAWLVEEMDKNVVRLVDPDLLDRLVDRVDDLVVVFYDEGKRKHEILVDELETMAAESAEDLGVVMIKVNNVGAANKRYGLYSLPSVVYYEDGVPNVYDEELTGQSRLRTWLQRQKYGSYIEKVTSELLQTLISKQEYVVTLFLDDCDRKPDSCEKILNQLEKADAELDKMGISFVSIEDHNFATKMEVVEFPAIVYFRNSEPLRFNGQVESCLAVIKFVTAFDHILIPGKIEEVGVNLLEYFIDEKEDVFTFFYHPKDSRSKKTLQILEGVDDVLEGDDINLLKCSDDDVDETYGIGYLPRLIYFKRGIPKPYEGNERDVEDITAWARKQVEAKELITVNLPILERLTDKFESLGVIFVEEDNRHRIGLVEDLESKIGDIAERNLHLAVADEGDHAREVLGLNNLPTLVHFSHNIPSVFYGSETSESVLAWLQLQGSQAVIEVVTHQILEDLREEREFVTVFFSGRSCDQDATCQKIRDNLEDIDDKLDAIGIAFVQTPDEDYPYNEHEISTLPALGLYRNGHFVQYLEPLADEEAVLKWLMDVDTLKLPGKIEKVNQKMLEYLYEKADNLVVLFYEDTSADKIVTSIENIDEDLDSDQIFLVKCNDAGAGETFGVLELPAFVYIKNGIPNFYPGDDLSDHVQILKWIKDEFKANRINEVTYTLLDKLIHKIANLGVVLYWDEGDKRVERLEEIADDCVQNNVGIVKLRAGLDADETIKRYGFEESHLPAAIFFEAQIPSIYEGSMEEEAEVFEWILR